MQKWGISKCFFVDGTIGTVFGAIEAGLVFALKVLSL
jgi:hypothetical protein